MTDPTFTCPRCGATSCNPNDAREGYCGVCRWWTGDPQLGQVDPRDDDWADAAMVGPPWPAIVSDESVPGGLVEFRDPNGGALLGRLVRDAAGVWHTEIPPAD